MKLTLLYNINISTAVADIIFMGNRLPFTKLSKALDIVALSPKSNPPACLAMAKKYRDL